MLVPILTMYLLKVQTQSVRPQVPLQVQLLIPIQAQVMVQLQQDLQMPELIRLQPP